MTKLLGVFLLLSLVACSGLTLQLPTASPAVTPTSTPTARPTPAPTSTTPAALILRVWVPVQFAPSSLLASGAANSASELLEKRLNEFQASHPEFHLEVRLKTLEGPGGILEALSAASAAAPSTLPDLVALPRPILEAAALKGLLHPFDGMTSLLDDPDWYPYARQLASLQDSSFGIPIAGDALVLAYRKSVLPKPPESWDALEHTKGTLAFAASSSNSEFTLALYQSAGGTLEDGQGRPKLGVNSLAQVLSFYQNSIKSGLISSKLDQLENNEQVWDQFTSKQADMSITWFTSYLQNVNILSPDERADVLFAPILSPEKKPYTLATGWVWALSSAQPEKQKLAVQLAEYLSDSAFVSQWVPASGYLPARPSVLLNWPAKQDIPVLEQVVNSAQLLPPADILASISFPLKQATLKTLHQEGTPQAVAQDAANSLKNP